MLDKFVDALPDPKNCRDKKELAQRMGIILLGAASSTFCSFIQFGSAEIPWNLVSVQECSYVEKIPIASHLQEQAPEHVHALRISPNEHEQT